MSPERRSIGLGLSCLGAVAVLTSLWQPWFRFTFPPAALDQIDQLSGQLGAFGGLLRTQAAALRAVGGIPLSAWDVFHAADVALLVLAAGLVALAGLVRLRLLTVEDARVISGLGTCAAAIVVYEIVVRPAPAPTGPGASPLALERGVWIALLGALAVVAGGALSRSRAIRWEEHAGAYGLLPWEDQTADPPPAWATSSSVPPPS